MKVTIKSAIRSLCNDFECFEDQQMIFQVGNTICIRELGRLDSEFICLSTAMDELLAFTGMNNRKGIFATQRIGKELELTMYSLTGDRKAILLPVDPLFAADLQKVHLLVDQYDNYLVYAVLRSKESNCVLLVDFGKGKVLAIGFLPSFEDVKVDIRENMTLSVCGNNGTYNYIKCLQYSAGKWEITEEALKKVQGQLIQHELLIGGRKLLVSRTSLLLMEDYEPSRSIELPLHGQTILRVVKVPRGLVVHLSDDSLRVFADDSEEVSFVPSGNLEFKKEAESRIEGFCLSSNQEELWFRTTNQDLFVWRCEGVGPLMEPSQLIATKVDGVCSQEREGSISLSAHKKLALLAGSHSVVLWNIQKAEVVLASEFGDAFQPGKKAVLTGAVNPDGTSIMLSFEDKVKIYQILFTKFKYLAEFQVKRVQQIVYSHGGQLVACRYGKGQNSCIKVYNLLRLTEVCIFKVQVDPLQIFWNELDDELYVATLAQSVQVYRISENTRVHNIKFEQPIRHARIDYRSKKLMVSTDRTIFMAQGGQIVEQLPVPIADFDFVFPLYGFYFIASRRGVLYWTNNIRFQNMAQLSLFTKPFQLLCRGGNLVAFSEFGEVLALSVKRQEVGRTKPTEEVVMIEKEEIISLFEKVREVESHFETLTTNAAIRSEEERQNYQNGIAQLREKYRDEVAFAHQRYQSMLEGKAKQEKESETLFERLEKGQSRGLFEVEKMYERKVEMEKEKVMTLEQEILAQKIRYEDLLKQLQKKYHREVQGVREEYAKALQQESSKVGRLKEGHLEDKRRVQMQLVEIEEENEITLRDVQLSKDEVILKLRTSLNRLTETNEHLQIQLESKQQHVDVLNENKQRTASELGRIQTKLTEAENRAKLLETELLQKKSMVSERDHLIKEQQHQIADLEKAKYVLSFRTTEIRKELEPKETVIDKLKSELLKLDEEYKELKKRNYSQEQKIQKLETINGIGKRESSDMKIQLKYKQRVHDELCSEIFMVVNTVDPKDWNGELVKIYQNHIKQEQHRDRQKKKKDDTSEEINRHLVHVEQSLLQVTSGNERIMKGKEKEVVRKIKENSELVYELNVMRKKENEHLKERKELLNQNARLTRQLTETANTTTRAHTAKTALTKRFVISRDLKSRDKHATLDVSDLSASKQGTTRELRKEKSRLSSARRTLMVQEEIKQKSGKFFELAKELETTRRELQVSKKTILLQQSQIEELNQRFFMSGEVGM